MGMGPGCQGVRGAGYGRARVGAAAGEAAMDFVAWVEGELLGEFDELEEALQEAALASAARRAEVVIEDVVGRREVTVRVESRVVGEGA